MEYIKQIKKLINHDEILSLYFVENWLKENHQIFVKTVNDHRCSKFKLPCLCCIRDEDCLFVCVYKTLSKEIEICKQNDFFQKLLIEYECVKDNKEKTTIWLKKALQFNVWETWSFNSEDYPDINTSYTNGKTNGKFQYFSLTIDGMEFKPIYDFANLVRKLFIKEKLLPNEFTKWLHEDEIDD